MVSGIDTCPHCGWSLLTGGCTNWDCPSKHQPAYTPTVAMWPQPCSACPAKDAEITSLTARLAASEAALATERNKLKSECEGCSRLSAAVARAEKAEYTATQVPQLRTRIQQLGTDLAAARADAVRGFAEALIAEGNEGSTDEWFRVFVRKFVARYLASLAGKEPTDG